VGRDEAQEIIDTIRFVISVLSQVWSDIV